MLIVQKLKSQSIDFEENSVVERIFRVLNQNHLRPIKRKEEDYSELKVQSEIDNEHGPVTDGGKLRYFRYISCTRHMFGKICNFLIDLLTT